MTIAAGYSDTLSLLKRELAQRLLSERRELWGELGEERMQKLVDRFWDGHMERSLVADLPALGLKQGARILDVAAGHGHFVDEASANGYDCRGIEPDEWTVQFAAARSEAAGSRVPLRERIIVSAGEALPFRDNSFDGVVSYQTLEHVDNPKDVVSEMLRVTEPGGVVYVHCPDYMSTFEGHYQLPWCPMFPRPLARIYLRCLRKPTAGLATIRYVTRSKVMRWLNQVAQQCGYRLSIADTEALARQERGCASSSGLTTWLHRVKHHLRALGRREVNISLVVNILEKR